MSPYQPGEDNQDPYEVGYKAGAASRDAEILQLQKLADEVHAARKVNAEHDRLLVKIAAKDAEIAELKKELYAVSVAIDDPRTDLTMSMVEVIADQHKERDHLREQVKMLRDALLTCSVGDFSTGHVIHPSFDEKLVEEALSATEPITETPTTGETA